MSRSLSQLGDWLCAAAVFCLAFFAGNIRGRRKSERERKRERWMERVVGLFSKGDVQDVLRN